VGFFSVWRIGNVVFQSACFVVKGLEVTRNAGPDFVARSVFVTLPVWRCAFCALLLD